MISIDFLLLFEEAANVNVGLPKKTITLMVEFTWFLSLNH